jgi:SAM-dependent methyltransferase
VKDCVVCPLCRARLDPSFACPSCRQTYPSVGGVRVLLPPADAHIDHFREQLGLVVQQGAETKRALEAQAEEPSAGASTRARLRGLAQGLAEQVDDIAAVLGPALGGPLPPDQHVGFPRGALDYLCYLHRDWAWGDGHDEECERSLSAVRRVAEGRGLGRTLVLGAGACRLAYDLHVQLGATQTAVVDVDPFLLVPAEAVIRGARLPMTEASVNAPEVESVSRRWTLVAPAGPLGADVFHCFLADGTKPPFAEGSFDTVVTPWFIDQVPTDLEAFLRAVHALLAPGGRWLNHGPLIYPGNSLPIGRWYSRQEIFELAGSVGFRMGACESSSERCLVSPLTGRGKLETVYTFTGQRD